MYKYMPSNHYTHIGTKYAVEIMNNVPLSNFLLPSQLNSSFTHRLLCPLYNGKGGTWRSVTLKL